MKLILNIVLIVLSLIIILFLLLCGSELKKEVIDEKYEYLDSIVYSGEYMFVCLMYFEVIGKEGDKCLKCGMVLEYNDNVGKINGLIYFM